jgi:hypothetical protein
MSDQLLEQILVELKHLRADLVGPATGRKQVPEAIAMRIIYTLCGVIVMLSAWFTGAKHLIGDASASSQDVASK